MLVSCYLFTGKEYGKLDRYKRQQRIETSSLNKIKAKINHFYISSFRNLPLFLLPDLIHK